VRVFDRLYGGGGVSGRCLWAANAYWGTPLRVGANHYARRLAERGWEVAFVSEPVSPLHLLRRAGRGEALDRLRDWRAGGGRDVAGRLFHYSPMTLLPHATPAGLRSRVTLDHWQRWTLPGVVRKLKREGFGEVDLLVVDAVRQGFWLDAVAHGRSVLRVTDRLEAFPAVTAAMVKRERELIGRVDHVIYTAATLEEHVLDAKPRAATYVPNGADVGHFLRAPGDAPPAKPAEYAGVETPIAVYVGAIASWFDVGLLCETAAQHRGVTFVVIGPVDTDVSALRGLANVRLLGRRPYEALPGYLRHADVGLIPFKRNALVDGVSPIKLYEYLASGLPVVATRWAELERVAPPAALCADAGDFVAAVGEVLANPAGDAGRAARIAFARGADWGGRLDLMLEAVGV
ncbi:MAG: glycosyltransferase, partial [Phycisphaerales bacterium JB063]